MQLHTPTKSFLFGSIILFTLVLTACGGKKHSDVVTTPVQQNPSGINCNLWKSNRTFMAASYGLAQSAGDKIYINKLSIQQLINSLKLDSDAHLEKFKTDLLDLLDHAPYHEDPLYTIEFTQPAISLRDRIALGIQSYLDQCPE